MIQTDFKFDNSYAKQLDGFYARVAGENAPAPALVKLNHPLAEELGLKLDKLSSLEIAQIFSGSVSPKGAAPLAQVYAGHQFGNYSPQLGDGRALLMGEVINRFGHRFDIHLKGSGRTPFSRGGDGKAALGPVLREYILGEAMHALNIPTTRALAAVTTGEKVMRNDLQAGAVLARVAASHLRIGTFQYFAAQDDIEKIKQLADYAIERHYPSLAESENPYLNLLAIVCEQQATLIAKWMLMGFVHGVMNTDNMTICGETIDYGPCAFMESYDPATVFSSIDRQGRYAYANQPPIAQWNLARFAETLLPLIDTDGDKAVELAVDKLKTFEDCYQAYWLDGMREKLGLTTTEADDLALVTELFEAMNGQDVDFTLLFRHLIDAVQGNVVPAQDLFDNLEKFDEWHGRWISRLARESISDKKRAENMKAVNPIYIPRNHKVEEALLAAEAESNYEPFERLLAVLARPFEEQEDCEDYAVPAPGDFPPYKTFCGT